MSNKRKQPRPKKQKTVAPLFSAPTIADINAVWGQLVNECPPADLPKLVPLACFVNEKLDEIRERGES